MINTVRRAHTDSFRALWEILRSRFFFVFFNIVIAGFSFTRFSYIFGHLDLQPT